MYLPFSVGFGNVATVVALLGAPAEKHERDLTGSGFEMETRTERLASLVKNEAAGSRAEKAVASTSMENPSSGVSVVCRSRGAIQTKRTVRIQCYCFIAISRISFLQHPSHHAEKGRRGGRVQ